MTAADRFIAESEIEPHYQEVTVRAARSSVWLARGDLDGADADARIALALARQAKDPQALVPALVSRAAVEVILGHPDKAADLRAEVRAVSAAIGGHGLYYVGAWWVAHLAGCPRTSSIQLERGHTVRPRRERPRRR